MIDREDSQWPKAQAVSIRCLIDRPSIGRTSSGRNPHKTLLVIGHNILIDRSIKQWKARSGRAAPVIGGEALKPDDVSGVPPAGGESRGSPAPLAHQRPLGATVEDSGCPIPCRTRGVPSPLRGFGVPSPIPLQRFGGSGCLENFGGSGCLESFGVFKLPERMGGPQFPLQKFGVSGCLEKFWGSGCSESFGGLGVPNSPEQILGVPKGVANPPKKSGCSGRGCSMP